MAPYRSFLAQQLLGVHYPVQDWCEHGATVPADIGVDEMLDLVLPLWQQCESAWPEREELTA